VRVKLKFRNQHGGLLAAVFLYLSIFAHIAMLEYKSNYMGGLKNLNGEKEDE